MTTKLAVCAALISVGCVASLHAAQKQKDAIAKIVVGQVISSVVRTETTASGFHLIVTEIIVKEDSGAETTVVLEGGTLNGITMRSSDIDVMPKKNQRIRIVLKMRESKFGLYPGKGNLQVLSQ